MKENYVIQLEHIVLLILKQLKWNYHQLKKKDQNTIKTHLEVANSFGLYFKSWDDELNEYYGYDNIDDQNVIQELIDKIKFYAELLFNKLLQSVKDKFEWDESNPNTCANHDYRK